MQFVQLDDQTRLLQFATGSELVATLQDHCAEYQIRNAMVSAIGALADPILAYFNTESKQYEERSLTGTYELTALFGTIAPLQDQPLLHAHVTLADARLKTIGGHLVRAKIGGTVELILRQFASDYAKQFDPSVGLKLWDLPGR